MFVNYADGLSKHYRATASGLSGRWVASHHLQSLFSALYVERKRLGSVEIRPLIENLKPHVFEVEGQGYECELFSMKTESEKGNEEMSHAHSLAPSLSTECCEH